MLLPISNKVKAFDWQLEASTELANAISVGESRLLRAGTGTGKMYMTMQAVRYWLETNPRTAAGSINPFPVLWLTPKSVKLQTQSVVHQYGLTTKVMVMSYSEIKSGMGAMYITWIKDAFKDESVAIWNLNMLPSLVICDECQVLKNPKSLQSRVLRALPSTVRHIWASATPFQRVGDAQSLFECFSVVTTYNTLPATDKTSERLLSWIASPRTKEDYSPSAVDRLRSSIERYIVELKNVRFKFPSKTKCVTIHFKSAAEQAAYNKLVQDLIDNLAKRKGRDGEFSYVHFLVEMQKMQQGAELLRVNQIAERVIAQLPKKAVIVASNFVDTLLGVYAELVEVHGIDPARIAIIRGGQKPEERQAMINDYQSGKRDIMLFTMKSGGVGVSMHHDRQTTKPRYIILPPTWSAIDLVQALGRGHRLTSESVTEQEILWYGGTIEDAVRIKVELKIKCISKCVTAKEQFVDTFASQIDKEIDKEALADAISATAQSPEQVDDDEVASEDDSLTGEGLDDPDYLAEYEAKEIYGDGR